MPTTACCDHGSLREAALSKCRRCWALSASSGVSDGFRNQDARRLTPCKPAYNCFRRCWARLGRFRLLWPRFGTKGAQQRLQ
eukprot:5941430-Alexandrium_andersonii.AAC.1